MESQDPAGQGCRREPRHVQQRHQCPSAMAGSWDATVATWTVLKTPQAPPTPLNLKP